MRLIILLSIFTVTACGVRGDLYLPEDSVKDAAPVDEKAEREIPGQQSDQTD